MARKVSTPLHGRFLAAVVIASLRNRGYQWPHASQVHALFSDRSGTPQLEAETVRKKLRALAEYSYAGHQLPYCMEDPDQAPRLAWEYVITTRDSARLAAASAALFECYGRPVPIVDFLEFCRQHLELEKSDVEYFLTRATNERSLYLRLHHGSFLWPGEDMEQREFDPDKFSADSRAARHWGIAPGPRMECEEDYLRILVGREDWTTVREQAQSFAPEGNLQAWEENLQEELSEATV